MDQDAYITMETFNFCYRLQTKVWSKVMFSQTSVIITSVHGGGVSGVSLRGSPGVTSPKTHGILRDTVNKRVVSILLEYILVFRIMKTLQRKHIPLL